MDKNVCKINAKKIGQGYIINCAGEKVLNTVEGFTSRCAVGNTDDYLKNFEKFISTEVLSLGEPPLISIVIPSYASEIKELCHTLISLCLQRYPVPAEILVFINEPKNVPESIGKINDLNEKFMRSLVSNETNGFSDELLELRKSLLSVLGKNESGLRLHCLRQVMEEGLAGVYQVVTASAIARVRALCDSVSGDDRERKIQCIQKHFDETLLFLFDDDLILEEPDVLERAYSCAVEKSAVVLGRLKIKKVETEEKYQGLLRDIMQLFLDLKHDRGLNFLSPRAMSLSRILKIGGVKIGQSFADQLFFAAAAKEGPRCFVNAITTIAESDSPGNGNFLKKFRLYLGGEDNDAPALFENVLARYEENTHRGKYKSADIENVISALRTRDVDKIVAVVSGLLSIL